MEYLVCPLCNEEDFDEIGFKTHIDFGYCKVYSELKRDAERYRFIEKQIPGWVDYLLETKENTMENNYTFT